MGDPAAALAERLLGTGPARPGTVLVALAMAALGAVSVRRLLVARANSPSWTI